ncbi:50S ribosomal protein L18 [[Mycoplasma] testudinis]|uniref:50S ribosomal protein L18 n=1 Tax=[Mycoplasma] testudinis TaxID=33924 RepID=UPI000483699A|nr:50S ribosomal protein L18 [[Mycoplasma] testudinis]
MKQINMNRSARRDMRHARVTKKFRLIDNSRPVLVVFKSNLHISVQVWDYITNKIIASSSSKQLKLKNGNKENAMTVGTDIAKKLLAQNVSEVAFDCGGSKYHGRIAALADAARAAGLKF